MCGICGFAAFDKDYRIEQSLLQRMANAIKHRGPDDDGYYQGRGAGLAHRRLSIIDLDTGRQPIYNEDGSKCIVFNGEIYNYPELRETLIDRGHRFETRTDTEVILHLYEDLGESCVQALRGMFAFGIWDNNERTLFLARDRLGIKPLYYYEAREGIYFSSELKSVLATALKNVEIDYSMVDQYLALNYTIGPETMLKGVRKLMPGNWLSWRDGKIRVAQYWDFNKIEQTRDSFDQCMERMQFLLEETTKMHLISDVPLGAFLSGGVDSSVTVGIMSELSDKPVKTFTVGYEENPDVSELRYARIVADHFKTEHHELILKPANFMEIVSDVVWHLEEPVAEYATIPLFLLSKLAKEHVTVMLSGEGADEIFAGYPIYRIMNGIEKYQQIPSVFRKSIFQPIFSRLLGDKREGKYLSWLSSPLEERYLGNGSYFTEPMRERLYSKDFRQSVDTSQVLRKIFSYYEKVEGKDPVERMLYLDTKTWLPEDLLIKADKMTMAASLELRVPFLDHKMVEFAASIPTAMKATFSKSKLIFKKYAEGLLPRETVYRKKMGFPVPVRQWLRGELNEIARDVLLDSRAQSRGLFNKEYVERLFRKHSDNADDLSKNIWNLVILEMWFRIFADGEYRWSQN